ncbi:MAG: hypothetical protein KGZ82_00370 [Bacteroidales bacterium]|nr:hypothetical protein [Bacteroidales bacterium]
MKKADNYRHYHELREKYPFFTYQSYTIDQKKDGFLLKFNFSLANEFYFTPSMFIPMREFYNAKPIERPALELFAFHIGMVELISYWKAACPPKVIIAPFALNEEQVTWWKHVYFQGLGEFFYLNSIDATEADFMQIVTSDNSMPDPVALPLSEKIIVPVGGGKDSVVSLELLKSMHQPLIPFIVNPRGASTGCTRIAGFGPDKTALVERSLDLKLLTLNAQGFLNGHTPFSALLAFVSSFVAVLSGARHIALSNESSANEATVADADVNHQYSKSIEFEADFRNYSQRWLHPQLNYFSILRPLNELQIVQLFSKYPAYFQTFKSCNAGSKTDSWCCNCPKCLFAYLMLSAFLPQTQMIRIFNENLLNKSSLKPFLDELLGLTDAKPFECVGTIDEVRAVTAELLQVEGGKNLALLASGTESVASGQSVETLISSYDHQHFLLPEFEKLIKRALNG